MPPFDAASSHSAEEGFELRRRRRLVHGAASSSPPPRSSRGGGITRCRDCWLRAKADCAHRCCSNCCSGRGFVCPAHVKSSSHAPAPQCSERSQQMLASLAASASTPAAVAPTRKRKRPRALHSVATPTTTSSSVGQPTATATVPEMLAREVSLDAVLFRRVRLGPGAEVAYHTSVTIGGHVFRGILYDVGPHSRSMASTDTGGSSDGSSQSTAGGGLLDLTLRL
ncbi:hypothetical protein BAE44_0018163 [Dichanthelium oligosanthes]|uniref:Protein SHI RELATED SEQUENCE 6 n=1 Tax=Dichanthelium oligosanthes TaxID=888268 RepID=A0A1E5V6T8_9POAL|nr:hypothetical protein BAE44_0018163 [Dichanthelium oligosanthes]